MIRLITVCRGELAAAFLEEHHWSPKRAAFGGVRIRRIAGLFHRA
jgi:hypothetical protein